MLIEEDQITVATKQQMRSRDKIKKTILLSPDNAKGYLDLADLHWSNYRFEEAARSCLSYLHLNSDTSKLYPKKGEAFRNLKVVFTCGGRGSRWKEFMGVPKQLVDCGERVPLIQRTLDQFSQALPGAEFYLLIGEDQTKGFEIINGCHLISRNYPADHSLGIEVFGHHAARQLDDADILVLYGDIFFSNAAIICIQDHCRHAKGIRKFGRKWKNPVHENNGGENFGWFIPLDQKDIILDWYLLTEKIYTGTPLFRHSSWEVVALISWARTKGITNPSDFRRAGISPSDACRGLVKTFERRDFDENLWVEIDDETEDFDFPIEYLNRLRLMVKRLC